jgi:hypothetical protein
VKIKYLPTNVRPTAKSRKWKTKESNHVCVGQSCDMTGCTRREKKGALFAGVVCRWSHDRPRSAGGRNSDGRHDVDLRTPQTTGGRMSTEPASRRHTGGNNEGRGDCTPTAVKRGRMCDSGVGKRLSCGMCVNEEVIISRRRSLISKWRVTPTWRPGSLSRVA